MSTTPDKPSRAETVRRRRQQEQRTRFQSVSQQATSGARPLVSRPRRTEAAGPRWMPGGLGRKRRWAIALGNGDELALPEIDLGQVLGTWRAYSLALVTVLGVLLLYLLADRGLYVTSINLGGAALVPAEEIFEASGMAGQHIFWVDPEAAAAKVRAVPGIAAAVIEVAYPAGVTLVVEERVPQVTLVEGDKKWWVDAAGQKFLSRGDLPGLLPLVNEGGGAVDALPAEAVAGALQLKQLRQNIEKLYYDPIHGLSYQDGRGWRGYFGVGQDMAQKLAVYEALVEQLMQQGERPTKISVEDLQTPYFRK